MQKVTPWGLVLCIGVEVSMDGGHIYGCLFLWAMIVVLPGGEGKSWSTGSIYVGIRLAVDTGAGEDFGA